MAKNSAARRLVAAVEAVEAMEPPKGFKVVEGGIPLRQPGDVLEGVYQGKGPDKKIKKKTIGTYLVERKGGGVVEVLASSQLEGFFAGCKKGQQVWIQRLGTVAGGKGRVNQYRCAVK